MKTKSIFIALLVAASAFALSNCSGKREHHHEGHDHEAEDTAAAASDSVATTSDAGKPQFDVDKVFQQQLAAVYTAYLALKDAFVASDDAKV
ncbi:MAG TPA: hypothetical protein VIN08_06940, partial [Ohtaekwangia sp.]|uniref:hypothetical protein n=1 Tax=Ohtaekwangia sp. TaxID=2066019 RepID=UPI002F958586